VVAAELSTVGGCLHFFVLPKRASIHEVELGFAKHSAVSISFLNRNDDTNARNNEK
ncbi:hypothetical protein TGAM01_v210908, partial [Trichoderma gamsii]